MDLTDVMDADDLANLMHEAAYRGKFSLEATRSAHGARERPAEPRACSRRRSGCTRAAAPAHAAGSRSGFRRLVRGAGLPAARQNVDVNGFEVDFVLARPVRRDRRPRPRAAAHEGRRPDPRRRAARRRLRRPPVHRGRRRPPAGEGPSEARGAATSRRRCGVATSTGSIVFGTLKRASRSAANVAQLGRRERRAQDDVRGDGLPPLRVGRPNTPASATAGCASSAASTSVGITFSPPETIVSTLRPRTISRPRSSSRPRSPVCRTPRGGRARRRRSRRPARSSRRCPGIGAPGGLRVAGLGDRDRGARLREPVGRRDRPAGVAGAGRAAPGRRARRRASRRAATAAAGDRSAARAGSARATRSSRRHGRPARAPPSSRRSPTATAPSARRRGSAATGTATARRDRARAPPRSPARCARMLPRVSSTARGTPVVPGRVDDEGRRGEAGERRRASGDGRAADRAAAAAAAALATLPASMPAVQRRIDHHRAPASRHDRLAQVHGHRNAPASRHACSATAKSSPGGSAIATRDAPRRLRRRPRTSEQLRVRQRTSEASTAIMSGAARLVQPGSTCRE